MSIGALLVDNVLNWKTLAAATALFGFFPGMILRLLVLGYPKDDPRRKELVAELYVMPYWRRPLWVAEQLETVTAEGLLPRIAGWGYTLLAGRVVFRWRLRSGVDMHRAHPDTFSIPSEEAKAAIRTGTAVKLMFSEGDWTERMWVEVARIPRRGRMAGTLLSDCGGTIPRLPPGKTIRFRAEHIIDIETPEDIDPAIIETTTAPP